MILILIAFIALTAFISTFLYDAITLSADAAKFLMLLSLILSAVFALKAKIGETDEKKLEDFKPTLATPIRTILIWAMAFETFFLVFSIEGISSGAFSIVFQGLAIITFFIFIYIDLAEDFLTYEIYNELNDFTATFSRRNWKFLILSGMAAVATVMFYDKAFQIVDHRIATGIISFGVVILSIFMAFLEKPFSTITLCIFYFIVTGIFITSV